MAHVAQALWRFVTATTERIAISANAAGTLCVLAMVFIVCYDILARGFFNAPFMGAVELVQFSLVFIVFLQLPDVVRVGKLTRSDGFLVLLKKRLPRLALWLQRLIDCIAAVFMTLAAYAIWPEFLKMWESKDFFGVPGVFTAPWWPIKLVIFISGVLCMILFIQKIVGGTRTPLQNVNANASLSAEQSAKPSERDST